MSVYVDPVFSARGPHGFSRWSHMWADTPDELHAMAEAVGMKRDWFQDKPGFPHYDLRPDHRAIALELGAQETDWRGPVKWMREQRGEKPLSANA